MPQRDGKLSLVPPLRQGVPIWRAEAPEKGSALQARTLQGSGEMGISQERGEQRPVQTNPSPNSESASGLRMFKEFSVAPMGCLDLLRDNL